MSHSQAPQPTPTIPGAYVVVSGDEVIAYDPYSRKRSRRIAKGVAGEYDAALINSVLISHKNVYLSGDDYVVDDELSISDASLTGVSGQTTITPSANLTEIVTLNDNARLLGVLVDADLKSFGVRVAGDNTYLESVEVVDTNLDGFIVGTSGKDVADSTLVNCCAHGCGVTWRGSPYEIYKGAHRVKLINCNAYNFSDSAYDVHSHAGESIPYDVQILGCSAHGSVTGPGDGVSVGDEAAVRIYGDSGINMVYNVHVSDIYAEDCSLGVCVNNCYDVSIAGGSIRNCTRAISALGNAQSRCSDLMISSCSWGVYDAATTGGSHEFSNLRFRNLTGYALYFRVAGAMVKGCVLDGITVDATAAIRIAANNINIDDLTMKNIACPAFYNPGGPFSGFRLTNSVLAGTTMALTNLTAPFIRNNEGYLAPGEIRTYKGTVATLTQDAFNSLDNPFGQSVALLALDVYVSTAATATSPNIDCGIGSSATTDYTNLFDDLPGETIGLYNSKIATPGAQTQPILWQSGAGNRYLNMSIKDAAATGMVATYVATVMGI